MRFKEFMSEVFDSDPKFKKSVSLGGWGWTRRATIGSRDILFRAVSGGNNEWDIEFSEVPSDVEKITIDDQNFDITSSGNALEVFALIKKCLLELIDEKSPEAITFTADKSEPSRANLYEKMVKKLNIPYSFERLDYLSRSLTVFRLEKNSHD